MSAPDTSNGQLPLNLADIDAGDYQVAAAYLFAPQTYMATPVHQAVICVTDRNGPSQVSSGWGQICTAHMIAMLEDSEKLSLIIDMGAGYRFIIDDPGIRSGKAIGANAVSTFHFHPRQPIRPLNKNQYAAETKRLQLIQD